MKQKDLFYMTYAIRLSEKGRLLAPPNPWVGCVIVNEEAIVGEGYHAEFGKEHAEVLALKQAGKMAKGATAYVTLEPCAHQGKTPPCTQALIEAGVRRVVIPFLDPDPKVRGHGKEVLEQAGVEVTVGVAADEARKSLLPYLHQRETGRPFVVLKIACSLDGKAAAADGTSQWITDKEARLNAHLLRAESGAIVIGSKTALKDHPQLTVRDLEKPCKQPLKIVLDRSGHIPPEHPLFENVRSLSPQELLKELAEQGVLQVLVEGGPTLQSAFLEAQLVDRCSLYIGACLIGEKGLPTFPNQPMITIEQAKRWRLDTVHRFGNTVRLDYVL